MADDSGSARRDPPRPSSETGPGSDSGSGPDSDSGFGSDSRSRPRVPRYVRDVLQTLGAVVLVGALLFALTGIWPPMVAVESPSMEPHIDTGDMVVVSDVNRYVAAAADENGIVTWAQADGYTRFSEGGDVVVFMPPDRRGLASPVIHRVRFHVEAGENWYDRADPDFVGAGVDGCAELANCPAPHAGYITKGDNNARYDQVGVDPIAPPVRAEWVRAKAQVRVPLLGWIRLVLAGKV